MVVALPSTAVKSGDGYRMVAAVLLLVGLVDDVGGGSGHLQRPDVHRRRKGVTHMIALLGTSLSAVVSLLCTTANNRGACALRYTK